MILEFWSFIILAMYYFIDSNNQQRGPVSANELLSYGVTNVTYVWKEGMTDWMRIMDVPELSSILSERSESSFYKRPFPITHGDSTGGGESRDSAKKSQKGRFPLRWLVVSITIIIAIVVFILTLKTYIL